MAFPDVPTDHWAYEAVNRLNLAGVISGYPDGTFRGNNPVTRYEVAAMLDRLWQALIVRHGFLSAKPDAADDTLVGSAEWNADHPVALRGN